MALRWTALPVAQLSRLSIGGVTQSSARLAHVVNKEKKMKKRSKRSPEWLAGLRSGFKPGHGEQIWVFNHYKMGLTVYSHGPVMKQARIMRQIPYNGKKLRPTKLRKDYWRPMAMIEFPAGLGAVGRSVFHRLREFRFRHELAWDPAEMRARIGELPPPKRGALPITKKAWTRAARRERGRKLNDQKANAVADIAAVLAGHAKGNKMRLERQDDDQWWRQITADNADPQNADGASDLVQRLVQATVWWREEDDRNHARSWSSNVTHGVLPDFKVQDGQVVFDIGKDGSPGSPGVVAEAAPRQTPGPDVQP